MIRNIYIDEKGMSISINSEKKLDLFLMVIFCVFTMAPIIQIISFLFHMNIRMNVMGIFFVLPVPLIMILYLLNNAWKTESIELSKDNLVFKKTNLLKTRDYEFSVNDIEKFDLNNPKSGNYTFDEKRLEMLNISPGKLLLYRKKSEMPFEFAELVSFAEAQNILKLITSFINNDLAFRTIITDIESREL